LSGGSWSITGGGADIFGTADTFHFVWQSLPGDGSVSANVVSQSPTDQWAKSGVMLRMSTDPGSPYYAVYTTPGNGLTVQARVAQGGNGLQVVDVPGSAPVYLGVTRTGTTFTAFFSSDGVGWTPINGSSTAIPSLSGAVLAGMAVTSHNTTALSTAVFQSVMVGPGTLKIGGGGGSAPPPPPPPHSTGSSPLCPTAAGAHLGSAVGIASVSGSGCAGYYVVDGAGRVSAFGAATWHGDMSGKALSTPIIGITATADGGGYWLLGADGGVFSFGDARFHGSTGDLHLNAPVVGMAVTATNGGYWIVAKDGGVFTFGDARFHGSTGGMRLNQPVDGIAVAPGGDGYWLVASDGGVFTFTKHGFFGSMGGRRLNKPIVGMSSAPAGTGYTLVGSDGGVFNFGRATFYGSLGSQPPPSPIVDLSPAPADTGYYLLTGTGAVYAFGPGAVYFGSA
jgi:hypothetical protein